MVINFYKWFRILLLVSNHVGDIILKFNAGVGLEEFVASSKSLD